MTWTVASRPLLSEEAELQAARRYGAPHGLDRWRHDVTSAEQRMGTGLSRLCRADEIHTTRFADWCTEMDHPVIEHRKLWEWVFILDELEAAGAAADGARGLGFGVGTEPITPLLASRGANVLATDLDGDAESAGAWASTGQHAAGVDALDRKQLCPPEVFAERVEFRAVDMTAIPADLVGFDFAWSSCALEHLGSLDEGWDFVERSLDCLRPGGMAVHTTEYNVSSNWRTVREGGTVLYRRRDVERLQRRLADQGHTLTLDLTPGEQPADCHVDAPPFSGPHLRVRLGRHTTTSIGFVITKAGTR